MKSVFGDPSSEGLDGSCGVDGFDGWIVLRIRNFASEDWKDFKAVLKSTTRGRNEVIRFAISSLVMMVSLHHRQSGVFSEWLARPANRPLLML